jgi:hypothetical protein
MKVVVGGGASRVTPPNWGGGCNHQIQKFGTQATAPPKVKIYRCGEKHDKGCPLLSRLVVVVVSGVPNQPMGLGGGGGGAGRTSL